MLSQQQIRNRQHLDHMEDDRYPIMLDLNDLGLIEVRVFFIAKRPYDHQERRIPIKCIGFAVSSIGEKREIDIVAACDDRIYSDERRHYNGCDRDFIAKFYLNELKDAIINHLTPLRLK